MDGSVRFITETVNTGNLSLNQGATNEGTGTTAVNSGGSNYGVWGARGTLSRRVTFVVKLNRTQERCGTLPLLPEYLLPLNPFSPMQTKRYSFLFILLLSVVASTSFSAEDASKTVLRILCYNIKHGQGRDNNVDLQRTAFLLTVSRM